MTVREARQEDFPELYALDQSCFAPGIAWSKAELAYFLRYPGNMGLAVETAGTIAGFAIAGVQLRRGKPLGRLITIDVRADYRRRGVGNQLLAAVEERLKARGAVALMLEVAVDNESAQAFYVRHGFVRTGRIPGYYLDRIDALTMEKPL